MHPADVVERFFAEVWNRRDLAVIDEIVHDSCVTHQVRSAPDPISSAARGPAALRQHIEAWLMAFPDMQVTTDHTCACGNEVISWVTMRGTRAPR